MAVLTFISKTKNIFSFLSQKKIKKSFLIFFLFFVLLVFPLSTKAGIGNWFRLSLVVLILYITGAIAYVFAILADFAFGLVKWILDPNFISWSYTNPSNNELIRIGLNTTQSLVNIILVLVLIYS